MKKRTIEVINWSNEALERQLVPAIEQAYNDVAKILDGLPEQMKIYFDSREIHDDYPADGTAYAHDIITLVINPKFADDVNAISKQLKQTIFHETFHIRQKFSLADPQRSALEAAVFEGCASVFEREYVPCQPLQSEYAQTSVQKLKSWYEEMKLITAEMYFEPSGETFRKWAFYDPESGETWRVYKTGTWIVDHVLVARNLDIIDLRDEEPGQIIEWFEEIIAQGKDL